MPLYIWFACVCVCVCVCVSAVEEDVIRLHIKKKRGGVAQYGLTSASSLSGSSLNPALSAVSSTSTSSSSLTASSGGASANPNAAPLPPLGYFLSQPRFQFGAPYEFSDSSEVSVGFPHKALGARWNVERKELSMGFQAAAVKMDASTQTHW
jgi:hypothetical protein